MLELYKNKRVLLASMHQKEIAIKEAFEKNLGCKIVVAENFNTDQFGTFSGEIKRKLSAYDALKNKAVTAANIFDYDYVISSEGSFGPHPYMFANCDTEMLLFYDRKLDLFIANYEISFDTNHAQLTLTKKNYKRNDYIEWLKNIKFPSHGLTIKSESNAIYKGIITLVELEAIIDKELSMNNNLTLETDMRAMMNPTRMNLIKLLANKLSQRIIKVCKKCSTPGFGNISNSGNLKCKLCYQETKTPKYKDIKCLKCDYFEREEITPGIEFGDPTYCDYCNP